MMGFKRLFLFLFLSISGCYNGIDYLVVGGTTETETETIIKYIVNDPEVDIWIDSFTQVAAYEDIDILWVIDGSCSMIRHESALLSGIEHMMNNLPIDINWRLKMITAGDGSRLTQSTTFPLTRGDTVSDAVAMYNQLPADGGEEGFASVQDYIMNDAYAQTWLRYDAALLVVFVSDEREQSIITVPAFISWYGAQRPEVYLSFIGNVDAADSVCSWAPSFDMIGRKYMDAVNYFGGTIVDICESDWSAGVDDATQNIVPIDEWELTHIPYEDTVVVFEDGQKMDPLSWNYDPATNIVQFIDRPLEGALVEIGYGIRYYSVSP